LEGAGQVRIRAKALAQVLKTVKQPKYTRIMSLLYTDNLPEVAPHPEPSPLYADNLRGVLNPQP